MPSAMTCGSHVLMRRVLGGVVTASLAYALYRLQKKVKLGIVVWSKSWFTEISSMWPGQAFSLQIEKELYDQKSEFQHIQVFNCGKTWGNVLILDGIIQATEKDEFAYQEMMTHVPLTSHPDPKKVLVIGGGDGGVLREIAKHVEVEEMHICELDSKVIEVSKLFLPSMACGYDDHRVRVHIKDGFEFMQQYKNEFDVIIVDSSDPVGPAEVLFEEPFYRAASEALTENGIMVCQGECMWLHLDVIKNVKSFASKLFQAVEYGFISIPSYPCGTIGILCCCKSSKFLCSNPTGKQPSDLESQTKYYNTDIHKSAFILPTFVKNSIK